MARRPISPPAVDLHQAILQDDPELIDMLLDKPTTDLNKINPLGETPLFASLKEHRSNQFIMQLIKAGCDIKISNAENLTPLHLAVQRSTTDIANALLKRGADVNAQELQIYDDDIFLHTLGSQYVNKKTPLHYAVECNNLEMVCMLLYYDANVYITSSDMATPLKYAVLFKRDYIVAALMEYYEKSYFSTTSIINTSGINNYVECEGIALLKYAHRHYSPDMFITIWYGIDHQMLWSSSKSETLLINYAHECMFTSPDWVEFLLVILSSSFIYSDIACINEQAIFFCELCCAFNRRRIRVSDRMTIINICLSLGIVPNRDSLIHAHLLYGFNEEFEAFLYSNREFETIVYCFPSFILSLEECDSEIILEIFKFHFNISTVYENILCASENYCIYMLGFFSLPRYIKGDLKAMCYEQDMWTTQICEKIMKKINRVPEFPTLLELSRNEIRKLIKKSVKTKLLYQYHDVIKSFNVPNHLKDILRFKKPLY